MSPALFQFAVPFLFPMISIPRQKAAVQAVAFSVAGVLVLVGLALLSLEATFHFRGVILRFTEVALGQN
jgi:hypothetical protein